jgi:heme oxygenase
MVTTESPLLPLAVGAARALTSRSFSQRASMNAGTDGDLIGVTPLLPTKPSLRMMLRAATAADHEGVDREFGLFDLTLRPSYTQFLMAHARVLGALEGGVAGIWSPSRARFPLLKADLAELGVAVSEGNSLPMRSTAARWGALYVLEGSRLGGGILARRVAPGLPTQYLSATHEAGSWRRFAEALEQVDGSESDSWRADAIGGAKLVFSRFAQSATEAR